MDPLYWRKRGSTPAEQVEGLGLFAPDPEPAPSAPHSGSSARGARDVEPRRKGQTWTIALTLAALSPGDVLSREEIGERTGIKDSSLCGRLSELCEVRVDRPSPPVERIRDACRARSGLMVDGYRLTKAGRAALRERGAA